MRSDRKRLLDILRNILVHEYFGIDKEALWNAVEKDVLRLKIHVERILEDLPD